MNKHTILLNYYKKYSSRGGERPQNHDDNITLYTNDRSYDKSYEYLKDITDEVLFTMAKYPNTSRATWPKPKEPDEK